RVLRVYTLMTVPQTHSLHNALPILRQQRSTLLKLARRQKLIQPPVSRNQSSGIVMTAIHQHHPHAQLANQLLIKRLQAPVAVERSEEHTSELQSRGHLVCRLLLVKK